MKHLVLFNPDQYRGDVVGCLGNPAAVTPTLDALVETDGVLFSQAYCQNPVCTPSRCSFMTGWYPHVRGHRTMYHMLQPEEPMLLRTLKQAGYWVWWGGKNDVVPGQGGFGDYCTVKHEPGPSANMHADLSWRGPAEGDDYYSFYAGCWPPAAQDSDWSHVREAVRVIESYDGTQPLCLYLPLSYPHPPYGVEEPYFSRIDRGLLPPRQPVPDTVKPAIEAGIRQGQGLTGWEESRWQELRATYYAMCNRIDEQLGLVLDALKRRGIYEDTAVCFFSDHGDYTGDYGLVEKTQNTFEDCLTRVPLLIKPPRDAGARPGIRQGLVELVDIPATVLDLLDLPPLSYTQFGRSLRPMLQGEEAGRDAVFCEGGRLHGERQAMELASLPEEGREQTPYWPRLSQQMQEGPAHTKAAMVRTATHKYVRRLYESDELYDLARDPGEQRNVIDDPAYCETLVSLQGRLLTFYQETCDVVPMREDQR